jgi:hypothetical protein
MAESCVEQAERIEETVLQPVDTWVDKEEKRCRDEPCNWWTLCLNKLFCWIAVVLVKVALLITTLVVRWLYRMVCTVVMLVVGVLALLVGIPGIFLQAVQDLWTLIKDGTYAVIGLVIFYALRIVDLDQSAIGVQGAKRKLTKEERALLFPIFRESLAYDAIEVVDGSAGLLTITGRALTMGFTIYLPTYHTPTLVHECVHVWQFQYRGTRYIGNSTLNQLDSMTFSRGYKPYDWRPGISAGTSWFALQSAEAQAMFVEDVYTGGMFDFTDPSQTDNTAWGAFFREDESGKNVFETYTKQANAAWRILRTR